MIWGKFLDPQLHGTRGNITKSAINNSEYQVAKNKVLVSFQTKITPHQVFGKLEL